MRLSVKSAIAFALLVAPLTVGCGSGDDNGTPVPQPEAGKEASASEAGANEAGSEGGEEAGPGSEGGLTDAGAGGQG